MYVYAFRFYAIQDVFWCACCGVGNKVFCANEYHRLVFKLMPSTEDMSYTTEEIRAFRQIPDYTAQFVQEFHSWLSLAERNRDVLRLCIRT